MRRRLGKILQVALFSAFVAHLGLVGCNTLEGAGEDIERAGEELEEEASD